MAENDWASERARDVCNVLSGDYGGVLRVPLKAVIDLHAAVAAELRKERERAEAAEKRAAALESALARVLGAAKSYRSDILCLTPYTNMLHFQHLYYEPKDCRRDTSIDAGEAALRDHAGALAEHDADVRKAALLEAKSHLAIKLDTIAGHHIGALLDELAEDGAKP